MKGCMCRRFRRGADGGVSEGLGEWDECVGGGWTYSAPCLWEVVHFVEMAESV